MRTIVMLEYISGGRHDGRSWPPAGAAIEVPDWEAEDLIRGRLAVPGPDRKPEPPPPPAPEPPAAAEPPAEAAPEPDPEPPAQAPAPSAPKQAWVDWAMLHGASEDDAHLSTKQQLMESYGDRP